MKVLHQEDATASTVIEAQEKFGWTSPGRRRMQADALRRQRARGLRHDCVAGLRILRYLAMADGVVTVEELNVIASYLESRFALLHVEHDAELTAHLMAGATSVAVTPKSLEIAVDTVARDRDYFTLVLDCALVLVEVEGDVSQLALHVLETLATAGTTAGWLDTREAASRLTNLCLGSDGAVRA